MSSNQTAMMNKKVKWMQWGMGSALVLWMATQPTVVVAATAPVPIGAPLIVDIAANDGGFDANAMVAQAGDGSAVVAWEHINGPLSSDVTVWAQRIANDGTPAGAPIDIDTETDSWTFGALGGVAADATGNFAVLWNATATGSSGAMVRLFNSDGTPRSAPQCVNPNCASGGTAVAGDIAMDNAGNFTLGWTSSDSNYSIPLVSQYKADGTLLKTIQSPIPANSIAGSFAMNRKTGSFAFSWIAQNVLWQYASPPVDGVSYLYISLTAYKVQIQLYNADGSVAGPPKLAQSCSGLYLSDDRNVAKPKQNLWGCELSVDALAMAIDDDGNSMLAWAEGTGSGTLPGGVLVNNWVARSYSPRGFELTGKFNLLSNPSAGGEIDIHPQTTLQLAAGTSKNFVATWTTWTWTTTTPPEPSQEEEQSNAQSVSLTGTPNGNPFVVFPLTPLPEFIGGGYQGVVQDAPSIAANAAGILTIAKATGAISANGNPGVLAQRYQMQ